MYVTLISVTVIGIITIIPSSISASLPELTAMSASMVRRPGSTIRIYCEFEKDVGKSDWTWQVSDPRDVQGKEEEEDSMVQIKNGELASDWSKTLVDQWNVELGATVQGNRDTLELRNLSENNTGGYTCLDGASINNRSNVIQLDVMDLPKMKVEKSEEYYNISCYMTHYSTKREDNDHFDVFNNEKRLRSYRNKENRNTINTYTVNLILDKKSELKQYSSFKIFTTVYNLSCEITDGNALLDMVKPIGDTEIDCQLTNSKANEKYTWQRKSRIHQLYYDAETLATASRLEIKKKTIFVATILVSVLITVFIIKSGQARHLIVARPSYLKDVRNKQHVIAGKYLSGITNNVVDSSMMCNNQTPDMKLGGAMTSAQIRMHVTPGTTERKDSKSKFGANSTRKNDILEKLAVNLPSAPHSSFADLTYDPTVRSTSANIASIVDGTDAIFVN